MFRSAKQDVAPPSTLSPATRQRGLADPDPASVGASGTPAPLPLRVASGAVQYTDSHIISQYDYYTTEVKRAPTGEITLEPHRQQYQFRTERKVPKLGMMIVGWGGNNGTTLTAAILAHKHNIVWRNKDGLQRPDYFGSLFMSSTTRLGTTATGEEVHVPLRDLLPMVHPNDIVISGWDISGLNMADAMHRAKVLPWELQTQLVPYMQDLHPLPSIYIPDFIAANQEDRADNLLTGSKREMVEQLRRHIREFKAREQLDKVIVLWSANTERFSNVVPGRNDTADNLLRALEEDYEEISPSTMFAIACILEHTPYINGSPQNTFVPGVIELAERYNTPVGGSDFKVGFRVVRCAGSQTKLKSVLVDFLINSGLKPVSIVSYNHLGNNDGKNLSAPQTFRSKEVSKSNVVDDMVASNPVLYAPGEHPDHTVVIKYVPYVGDSKRAIDEYTSRIFMGGTNTISIYNVCEDSLLAAPIMLDLVLLMELSTRIQFRNEEVTEWAHFHPVASVLSFLLKAPLTPPGTPVVNALFKQRACIVNLMRACLGLAPESDLLLEFKQPPEVLYRHVKRPPAIEQEEGAGAPDAEVTLRQLTKPPLSALHEHEAKPGSLRATALSG